jgi:hypothetical protein
MKQQFAAPFLFQLPRRIGKKRPFDSEIESRPLFEVFAEGCDASEDSNNVARVSTDFFATRTVNYGPSAACDRVGHDRGDDIVAAGLQSVGIPSGQYLIPQGGTRRSFPECATGRCYESCRKLKRIRVRVGRFHLFHRRDGDMRRSRIEYALLCICSLCRHVCRAAQLDAFHQESHT